MKERLSVRDLTVGVLLGFMSICVLTGVATFAIYLCMGGTMIFLTISKWSIFIGFFSLMAGVIAGVVSAYSE